MTSRTPQQHDADVGLVPTSASVGPPPAVVAVAARR
jgi:hypothetical protein